MVFILKRQIRGVQGQIGELQMDQTFKAMAELRRLALSHHTGKHNLVWRFRENVTNNVSLRTTRILPLTDALDGFVGTTHFEFENIFVSFVRIWLHDSVTIYVRK